MHITKGHIPEPHTTIETVTDPIATAVARARFERGRLNDAWLQANWNQIVPNAIGKFLAVAGQEAYIATTPEEAWEWAGRVHPEDDAATVQYVLPEQGPRIYANHW